MLKPQELAPANIVVLGAGVIGLSTALTLAEQLPKPNVTILAKHFPGDYDIEYCSPWAGGNWCSAAHDNSLLESFDRVTFKRFQSITARNPEAGLQLSPLRMIFDQTAKEAGILSRGTNKVWYDELVGGLVPVLEDELPEGAVFGLDCPATFVINTQVYLQWLLTRCRDAGIELVRRSITHIDEALLDCKVRAVFNCTGLGSFSLGGVNDHALYPARGQTVLVQQPLQPLTRMYFRSPARVDNDVSYVFQRPLGGGVVLGGCREDGSWDGRVDPALARRIMERCCALAPELGKPEDLKVIKHGVGLRPGRRGGPRIELEVRDLGRPVVHNYGAAGAGFQASWWVCNVTQMKQRPYYLSSGKCISQLTTPTD